MNSGETCVAQRIRWVAFDRRFIRRPGRLKADQTAARLGLLPSQVELVQERLGILRAHEAEERCDASEYGHDSMLPAPMPPRSPERRGRTRQITELPRREIRCDSVILDGGHRRRRFTSRPNARRGPTFHPDRLELLNECRDRRVRTYAN